MNDLVQRLRRHDGMLGVLVEEAADEIEQLRAELELALDDNARLRIDTDRLIYEVERLRSLIRGYAGRFVTRQDVRDAFEQSSKNT